MQIRKGFWPRQLVYSIITTSLLGWSMYAQDVSSQTPQPGKLHADSPKAGDSQAPSEQKRLFGIVPNYRTFSIQQTYSPITPGQKFSIARQDAFDRGTIILAAAFAGEAQLTKADPVFGKGPSAYGRYFITAYADYAIGDFMTEGIFPTFFHQDPRYFRLGRGSKLNRVGYSIAQLFSTRTDSGHRAFNVSEVFGNATAVAISQSYYPDTRDAPDAVSKLGTQIGVDLVSNVLKEFSPDIYRVFSRRKSRNP